MNDEAKTTESPPKTAALYVRVSTLTQANHQTDAAQTEALTTWANANGYATRLYADLGKTGKNTDRPEFQRMMNDARAGKLQIVAVTKLDRLGRSTINLLDTIAELEKLGVAFVSLGNAIDTGSPQGKLMLTILSAMAEYERTLIQERMDSGKARAIAKGVQFGPKTRMFDLAEVRRWINEDKISLSAAARMVRWTKANGKTGHGVSVNTLVARLRATEPEQQQTAEKGQA